jgi:hypothetical protein
LQVVDLPAKILVADSCSFSDRLGTAFVHLKRVSYGVIELFRSISKQLCRQFLQSMRTHRPLR